jgi:hypothetical protein
MKTKKPSRRTPRITPFLVAALCSGVVQGIALAATPADSVSSFGSADKFEQLAASDLMILGPVEAVDLRAATIQVLGQTVRFPESAQQRILLRLVPGNVVAVRGQILTAGEIAATAVSITAHQYVAGAQPVFVRGVVTALRADVGVLLIGRLSVDYTGALYSLDAGSLSEGAEVVFSGIQAVPNGSALALSAAISSKGIAGSDLQARGIAGSDLQARGIAGSDLQAQGIAGSDLQARGIAGSDLQAQGIAGSDLQAQGIAGSDLQARGIAGSDLQARGIAGSDLQARGIAGSDMAGISGSDF